jgi:hypothetical protein
MIKSNTCPYCGGPYTIAQSCTGPRTDNSAENTCPEMTQHRKLVQLAAELAEHEVVPRG